MKKILVFLLTLALVLAISVSGFGFESEYFDLPLILGFHESQDNSFYGYRYVSASKDVDLNRWTYRAFISEYIEDDSDYMLPGDTIMPDEEIYGAQLEEDQAELTETEENIDYSSYAKELFDEELMKNELEEYKNGDEHFESGHYGYEQNEAKGYKYPFIRWSYDFTTLYNHKEYHKSACVPTSSYYCIYVEVTSTVSAEDCESLFNEVMSTIEIENYDSSVQDSLDIEFSVNEDVIPYVATPAPTVTRGFSIKFDIIPIIIFLIVIIVVVAVKKKKEKKSAEDKNLDN